MNMTYADYLNLESLMSLQNPRVPETADLEVVQAERFFIVVHQCSELWLGQAIGDIDAAIGSMILPHQPGDLELSLEYLERAMGVLHILYEHVLSLERLPLRGFAEFRPYLGTASGAQSTGFRILDQRLGDDQRTSPLYEAFAAAVADADMTVKQVCQVGARSGVLHRLAEALLGLGNGYWRWKMAHVAVVARTLGTQSGTGGSSGTQYLMDRLTMPFAELRAFRGSVHPTAAAV